MVSRPGRKPRSREERAERRRQMNELMRIGLGDEPAEIGALFRPYSAGAPVTEAELVELERVGDRLRERYRHLIADDAKRRYLIREAAARQARAELIDKYSAAEIHGEEEPSDE